MYHDERYVSVSERTGRREPLTNDKTPGTRDLTSVMLLVLKNEGKKKQRGNTSRNKQLFYAKIGITYSHQSEGCRIVELEIVVPQVAKQLFRLLLFSWLLRSWDISLFILGRCNMLRYIHVDDAESVFDCPVYVRH